MEYTYTYSQNISVSNLQSKTVEIMNRLNIHIRKNIAKDNHFNLTIRNDTSLEADFKYDKIGSKIVQGVFDTSGRWYVNPTIILTSMLDSIASKKKYTSRKVYIRSLSIIVHELTHYYQTTFVNDNYYAPDIIPLNMFRRYIRQPVEFEAFAVGSFYYLSVLCKKTLKRIMKGNITIDKKFELLINAFWKEWNPSDPPVF